MIARNSDNVILYGADWSLNETCAFNEKLKKRDSTTNLANATYYDIKTPSGFVGGDYYYINGEFVRTEQGTKRHIENVYQEITGSTQLRLDDFAQTKTYDSILSACTYATSAIERLQAEGQYCVTSRDNTWETLYTILAEVKEGTRPMPSGYDEIEPELPVLAWP